MEFVILISTPGKSWKLSESHGKSWRSNMFGKNITDESETGFNFRKKYTQLSIHFMPFNSGKYAK